MGIKKIFMVKKSQLSKFYFFATLEITHLFFLTDFVSLPKGKK